MNTQDVLKYGHLWVLKHLEGFSDEQWETPGVCGVWSVREIIAHLASFEHVLIEVFRECLAQQGPKDTLDQFRSRRGDEFNEIQVGLRNKMSQQRVLSEYSEAHAQAQALSSQIPKETLSQPGTIPWYGLQYAMDDFIVYTFYGHKREHCAQIAIYRDQLKQEGALDVPG